MIKNGKLKIKIAPPPYSFEYKQQVYSLSKSFAATAIGFLCDDKKLNIDDKLIDIFSDKAPKNAGKNLSEMRLVHLLSMNTGHARCLLGNIKDEKDPVRKFMTYEPKYAPALIFVITMRLNLFFRKQSKDTPVCLCLIFLNSDFLSR